MDNIVSNKSDDFMRHISDQVDDMIEGSVPPDQILKSLVLAAEKLIPQDEACSILVLDAKGLLRNGASPKLPPDYLRAIDKLKPDPNIGTCAAAAATGKMVITSSFLEDNKWSELKHFPLSIGFVGAWSFPIKTEDGQVLGTFGTYFKTNRTPGQEEIETVQMLARLAAKVLSRYSMY